MSEREKSFLGTKKITMSTTDEVLEMYNHFKDNGINNQILNLKGYSKDGNINTTPYRMKFVESKNKFKTLVEEVKKDNNDIFLTNDRSEERRVGKECKSRWTKYNEKKKR